MSSRQSFNALSLATVKNILIVNITFQLGDNLLLGLVKIYLEREILYKLYFYAYNIFLKINYNILKFNLNMNLCSLY